MCRINVSGRLNCIVFDKTGTITEDGLDVHGVQLRDGHLLTELKSPKDETCSDIEKHFFSALTTCHSLQSVDGTIVGDPIDLKMFELTKMVRLTSFHLNKSIMLIIQTTTNQFSFETLKKHLN